jgi:integrase/recombinase XerD
MAISSEKVNTKPLNQVQSLHQSLDGIPLGGLIRQFLNYLHIEAGLSENTILAYGRDLRDFAGFCVIENITAITQVTPLLIQGFMKIQTQAQHKAENSISRALVAVKMFLRYCQLIGKLTDDFTTILDGPKLWQRLPGMCNKAQVVLLLESPTEEDPYCLRDRALLELLYATGMRASEVAKLQIKFVDLKIGYLRCLGKGQKERVIPISRAAIKSVEDYLLNQRPMMANQHSADNLLISRTGRPMGRIEVWRVVKKYALRCGLPKNMTVHTLRHCFASHLLAGGADLRSVQEMLGHVDIATTQIYTHVDQERLRAIHRQFHPRP